ncbi:DUF2505 domain-containing protein [Mycolicibacterium obuense]|uniref:DUF2505 domain-containing protein n=1 Tax=Mycolicibacterium obuense TaxID=1807 RepID=A0A0M2JYJ1_9MYCO|nr:MULTISPECIES: DUF2505 domain-containing protein [Mycobacteriaceae]KKE99690.1 hypothetical protein WN67_22675 [Mycolicibacterium obuense]TDL08661.1 DUF2505 domain-containing protein [Mycolicibacterium obuense]
MARTVVFAVHSTASVEQIHHAFCDERYWRARLKKFGGFGTLETLAVGQDGTATVVVSQNLRPESLPSLVSRFFPREWKVVQSETWRPVAADRVEGEVTITTYGAPGAGSGRILVCPTPSGARLDCTATVTFNAPLVGGSIEAVMGKLLAQQIGVIGKFTTMWIAESVA